MHRKTIQHQTQGFRRASHVRRIGLRQCGPLRPKYTPRELHPLKKRVNQFTLGLR